MEIKTNPGANSKSFTMIDGFSPDITVKVDGATITATLNSSKKYSSDTVQGGQYDCHARSYTEYTAHQVTIRKAADGSISSKYVCEDVCETVIQNPYHAPRNGGFYDKSIEKTPGKSDEAIETALINAAEICRMIDKGIPLVEGVKFYDVEAAEVNSIVEHVTATEKEEAAQEAEFVATFEQMQEEATLVGEPATEVLPE